MSIYSLGINAAYHDSAAALVRDGAVVAAAEEERFTHIKHAKRPLPFTAWELPFHSIDYCLKAAGITLADLDHVAYSYEPALIAPTLRPSDTISLPLVPPKAEHGSPESPWDALFVSHIYNARGQLLDGAPHHLDKLRNAAPRASFEWHYIDHHLCHEASAYLAAPYDECAVLVM